MAEFVQSRVADWTVAHDPRMLRALPNRVAGYPDTVQFAFIVTIALGAWLLFWLQPLFAKMVLPLLGGAPAVWNTAVVFYQAVLLAGYAYAHLSMRWLGVKRQSHLHIVLLLVATVALPLSVASGWTPPTQETPIPWLFALLAVSIGLPFFALSATAPLLQAWIAASGHPTAQNPYPLYAASNAGSILALLAFPFLLEPLFGLTMQSWLWSGAYLLFIFLMALCARLAWKAPQDGQSRVATSVAAPAPSLKHRLHWFVLAFVPASLLLGVTLHITTHVVALPLFWVVPLVLYLLSFVLVFARRTLLPHSWMLRIQPYFLIFLVLILPFLIQNTWPAVLLHLVTFFVTAMVCHGELARLKPPPARLTAFYFWQAFGGVSGGAATALLAPLLFNTIVEYPLMLVASCLLRPGLSWPKDRAAVWDLGWPVLIAGPVLVIAFTPLKSLFALGAPAVYLYAVIAGVLCFSAASRTLRFALSIAALLVAGAFAGGVGTDVLVSDRSFFGVSRVRAQGAGFHVLWHGATIHGVQRMTLAYRREPQTYYVREGPVGQVFSSMRAGSSLGNIGVIGLGPGAAACYRRRGESWTFFEIDPVVVRLARDKRFFTYLAECAPEAEIRYGDGRRALSQDPDRRYEVLILDAFSGHVVPLHLLTREAFQTYFDGLSDDGIILINVSSGYFNLARAIAGVAKDLGLTALLQHYRPNDPGARMRFGFGSDWILLSANRGRLEPFLADRRWQSLSGTGQPPLWTDDYSNVFGVLRW